MNANHNNRWYEDTSFEMSFYGSDDENNSLEPYPGTSSLDLDEDDFEIIEEPFSEYPDDMDYDE